MHGGRLARAALAALVAIAVVEPIVGAGLTHAPTAQRSARKASKRRQPAPRKGRMKRQTSNAMRLDGPLSLGGWGGDHVLLTSDEGRTRIEFDCAHAAIGQRIELDADGNFDVRGEYIREHAGPQRDGEKPDVHPARFSGRVRDGAMTLTVTLTDTGTTVGTFDLGHGREPRIFKCL